MSNIVFNTTPINYLVLIDHIAVLRHLYAHVIIPQAVFGELQDEGTPAKVKEWVVLPPAWLEVRTVSVPLNTSLAFLDVGEREAIHLAKELQADALISDEPDGREEAQRQGLRVIGTLRVLYDAAGAGLCNLEQAYERLQHTTFRAHPQLFKTFLDAHHQQATDPWLASWIARLVTWTNPPSSPAAPIPRGRGSGGGGKTHQVTGSMVTFPLDRAAGALYKTPSVSIG